MIVACILRFSFFGQLLTVFRKAQYATWRNRPLAAYRVTYFFEAGKVGWSENYYLNAADATLAQKAEAALARSRINLCSPVDASGPYLTHARITPLDPAGPSQIFTHYIHSPYFVEDIADMPWTGIYANTTDVNGKTLKRLLRGVPDFSTLQPWFSPSDVAQWNQQFNVFRVSLLNDGWAHRVKQQIRANDKVITALSIDATTGYLKVTTAAHGLANTDTISFRKVKANKPVTGEHPIIVVDSSNFLIPGCWPGTITFGGVGWWFKNVWLYPDINAARVGRKGKRDTGRPFGLLRGRRPKRTC